MKSSRVRTRRASLTDLFWLETLLFYLCAPQPAHAFPQKLGDLDEDAAPTVLAPLDSGLLLNVPFTVLGGSPEGTVSLRLANVLVANAQANPVQPLTLRDGAVIVSSALPAQFVSIVREGSSVRLRVAGTEARSYVIQRSSDLTTWVPISTNTVVGGAIEFTQPTSANTQRFYRAILAQ